MGVRIEANYLLAVYIIVPLSLLLLLAALLYICCHRRYRLNWFERSILEEHDVEKERLCTLSPRPSVSVTTARRGSSRLGWAGPLGNMLGSSSGSPASDHGERFWVPPAVLQRKRAQSLVPAILHHRDSSEEEVQSSGAVTPSSMSGLRELVFAFPAEKFGGSLGAGMDLPPPSSPAPSPVPPPQLQKRRASMHDAIDHTKIDAKLYSKIQSFRQQSVCSIQEENLGAINFSLDYNKETSLLTVRVIQARDLVPRDLSGTVDPYCKVCLQPFDKIQLQSKIHKETLQPEFEEEFIFEVSNADLPSSVLEILIFHFDQYSQDECIGQVHFSLDYVDLSERVVLWKGISAYEDQKTKETADLGDLMFSLSYLSSAERLTVIVAKARNLRHAEEGRVTMDPYVKVALMYAGKKLKKKKTSIKHNTANPVWNEALVFGLGREFLKNVYLEFTVLHDNKIGTDELLGRLKIGADSATDELAHWNEMVSGKNTVARWFSLQS